MLKKEEFELPEGVIYLDGNSLGPLPKRAREEMDRVLRDEWGKMLITAWNQADWMDLPSRLGDMISPIVGGGTGNITTGDTLSLKMMQALHASLQLRPERKVVLSDTGNFPTDLYMAQGLLSALGDGYELRAVAPEDVSDALNESVAVMMLTHVDYRTGRMHDMEALTEKAHEVGAIALWDLAHSAGAVEVQLQKWNVDLAAGCTYKYLNGGPGAPAFIYVRPELVDKIQPLMSGWLGHEAPFAFDLDYRPAEGIERMRVGTPPILQMRMLEVALGLWKDVSMQQIREKSLELTSIFVEFIDGIPELELSSPRESKLRGSQISVAHPNAYEIMQSLIEKGVIGDFRAPNLMRFGFTPLYIDKNDVFKATEILKEILDTKSYLNPKYSKREKVT